MSNEKLLTAIAYIWAAFGGYWIVFAGIGVPYAGEARSKKLSRMAILLTTFGMLFLIHSLVAPITLVILAVAWSALGLYWSTPANTAEAGEPDGYRFLRLAVLALTFALLFWNRTAVGFLGARFLSPDSPAFARAGFASALAGMAVATWARVALGRFWSDRVIVQTDHQLIRTGPYAHMRHPIYSGVLLGVLGTALVLGEWRGLMAFALLLTNYAIKAKREERILADRFPDQFQEHMTRAGFLLPRLRSR